MNETKEEIDKIIGFRLRTIRQARHMTQKEAALSCGMTNQALSEIELGKHGCTMRKLMLLGQVYNVEVWMILHPKWQTLTGSGREVL